MQTRVVVLTLALAFFSFVLASPVMVAESSELLARNASNPISGLQLCLKICIDLQVKIKAILVIIGKSIAHPRVEACFLTGPNSQTSSRL